MPKQYRLDKLEMPELEAMEPKARSKCMRAGLRVITLWLRANVPDSGIKRKGKLKKSIRYSSQKRGLMGKVRAVAPHAHLVHEGTKGPRRVKLNPRRAEPAKALRIPGIGFRLYATAGPMPANPFLIRAGEATRDEVEAALRQAMVEAAEAVLEGAK